MAKKKTMGREDDPEELTYFQDLQGYAKRNAHGRMRKGGMFSLCVRASFGACYDFNLHAWTEKNSEAAYFWLPALRGICEDLLVLNYIHGMAPAVREELITKLIAHELETNLQTQHAFFGAIRPYQPHLRPARSVTELNTLEDEIRSIWRANGWPQMFRGVKPPTRDMAAKKGGAVLESLYDYLYRVTSNTVHFNVSGLLRTGWGKPNVFAFSPRNFHRYYTMFGRTYGAYMFCCYFELFGRFIRTNATEKEKVHRIRKAILYQDRWPEMVTFEEMNLRPPQWNVLQTIGAFMDGECHRRILDVGRGASNNATRRTGFAGR